MTARPRLLVGVVLSCIVGACAGRLGGGGDDPDTSAVQLALTTVPSAVGCVRIDVVGTKSVSQTFAVTPGQPSTLTVAGLPRGAVTVSGAAFDGACTSPPPEPTWIADPVAADLTPGRVVPVAITMHPNQRATVQIDFQDDTDGAAPLADAGSDVRTDAAAPAGTFVDQYSGTSNAGYVVSMNNHAIQSFTAGITGQLTLVEIGIGRITATGSQRIRLNVRDGGTLLGSAILTASSLPPGYGYTVFRDSRGPGTFDLRAANIRVTAGHAYQLELEGLDILSTGACKLGTCTNAPDQLCAIADDCTLLAEFGVSASTVDPYAAGSLSMTTTGGNVALPGVDATFATIVQTP